MNGIRMNQLVAPTSFITSISRRRANIAMRMVLKISTMAAIAARRRRWPRTMPLRKPEQPLHASGWSSSALTTSNTPGVVLVLVAERGDRRDLGVRRARPGTTVGSTSGVTLSTISGWSLEELLELLVGLLLVDVGRTASTSGFSSSVVSSASRWLGWIFGSMKTMNSMPPFHCRVALLDAPGG